MTSQRKNVPNGTVWFLNKGFIGRAVAKISS